MSPRVTAKSVAVVAAAASMPFAFASPLSAAHPSSIFKRDPPPALPECATEGDLKWQPGKWETSRPPSPDVILCVLLKLTAFVGGIFQSLTLTRTAAIMCRLSVPMAL